MRWKLLLFLVYIKTVVGQSYLENNIFGESFPSHGVDDVIKSVSKYSEQHKEYVEQLKNHELGAQVLSMVKNLKSSKQGEYSQDFMRKIDDIEDEEEDEENSTFAELKSEGKSSVLSVVKEKRVKKKAEKLRKARKDRALLKNGVVQFLEEGSELKVNSERWWLQPKPAASTKVTYGRSNDWWRCQCQPPRWTCKRVMTCLAPEITEEDRLKEEAMREQAAASNGGRLPPSKLESLKFHPGALDCAAMKLWDCEWTRHCDCLLPWKNVPQCRPLKKVTPKNCPVICQKKAWPWNWLCSSYCWCPGCSSPFCPWYFWFTLVCRNHCVCEARCPESPISLDE